MSAKRVPPEIFRAYDIRGIAGEQLSAAVAQRIGGAIGSEALANGIDTLLAARDGRLSSPELFAALTTGILASGCDVANLGVAPTPVLYFATHTTPYDSGVMLTASHNPANYNGMKLVFHRASLSAGQIQRLRERTEAGGVTSGAGRLRDLPIIESYLAAVSGDLRLARALKVVIDCANAVAAVVAPALFERLSCEVVALNRELDGNFPNHHPDPTVPANLATLRREVVARRADLGIAFDGDGDRLGLVDETGTIVEAEAILALLAEDIVPRYPGAKIVYDVKCGNRLPRRIRELGGEPQMRRSGHSFMKLAMRETGAPLGGELSAHIFIKDRWFGFDDGIYAAARVAELLAARPGPASEAFGGGLEGFRTGELRLPAADERKFALIERIIELADFGDAEIIKIDGLRVEYADGWGLIRASNTTPALLCRFEADSRERLAAIQADFRELILRADDSLQPPF
ncbi:MAG: phosphomannomutase/phosphoglucomutase [Gammaproteobacteria bacterium]|nr:phosphomannomutase/phosphoglucomutase [Gammaproteobacteria bacterium]